MEFIAATFSREEDFFMHIIILITLKVFIITLARRLKYRKGKNGKGLLRGIKALLGPILRIPHYMIRIGSGIRGLLT